MISKEILKTDLLDIIFEDRNKDYGAYALRKTYNQRLQWALGISLGLIFLLATTRFRKENSDRQIAGRKTEVTLSPFDISKPKTLDAQPLKKTTNVAQIKNTRINIVPDVQVKKPEVPTPDELQTALTSTVNRRGIPPDSSTGSTSSTNVGETNSNKQSPSPSTFLPRSAEAEFPGGKEAFAKFLTRNLIIPGDLEAGEKKIVLVRFMVDTEGAISKIEIMQTDADDYSREVTRVLNKMPKWIPAMQNGVKLATWFTQPVTFIGGDQ